MPCFSRRFLVRSGAALAVLSLARCAVQPSALAHMQGDTALLIAGLRGVLPALDATPSSILPPSDLAALQLNIQEASLFANDIATAQSEAQAAAPVQSMAEAVGGAVRTVDRLRLPPHVRSVFAAADALLPAIAAPVGRPAAVAFYSADQARFILRQSAGLAA